LEATVIKTIEDGHMTKDLALLISGGTANPPRHTWLNTFEFIDKVAENLTAALKK
jgi:isocitrate dehydrogenase